MCDAQEPIKAEPAILTLGAICDRLCFTVSASFLTDVLRIKAAGMSQRKTPFYTERQFGLICRQLQAHVAAVAEVHEVAA